MLRKTLKVQVLTDSETASNFIIMKTSNTEKGLMPDVKAARET